MSGTEMFEVMSAYFLPLTLFDGFGVQPAKVAFVVPDSGVSRHNGDLI